MDRLHPPAKRGDEPGHGHGAGRDVRAFGRDAEGDELGRDMLAGEARGVGQKADRIAAFPKRSDGDVSAGDKRVAVINHAIQVQGDDLDGGERLPERRGALPGHAYFPPASSMSFL